MRETILTGMEFPPPNAIGLGFSTDAVDLAANAVRRFYLKNNLVSGQIVIADVFVFWPSGSKGGRVLMGTRTTSDVIGTGLTMRWLDAQRAGSPVARLESDSATLLNASLVGVEFVGPAGRTIPLGWRLNVQNMFRIMEESSNGGMGVIFRWFEP